MELLQKLKGRLKAEKKMWIPVCIGILAVLLLVLSELLPASTQDENEAGVQQGDLTAYCESLEERLSATIASVQNVGRVRVMLTLSSGGTTEYATDGRSQINRQAESYSENRETEYVLLDRGGQDAGMVLRTTQPSVQGVIVVCDGADDPQVASGVTEAVCASLGVGADRVSILKMQPEEESA